MVPASVRPTADSPRLQCDLESEHQGLAARDQYIQVRPYMSATRSTCMFHACTSCKILQHDVNSRNGV